MLQCGYRKPEYLYLYIMRLSQFEIENIINLAQHHFGTDVKVFLFGSRADNTKRGGDIDLFIQTHSHKPDVREKNEFTADLMLKIGEQKVDVVLDNDRLHTSDFYLTILRTGKQLC
jgi:uncharacterized protein